MSELRFISELFIEDVLKEGTISINGRHIDKYDDINVFLTETEKNNKTGYYIWDNIINKKLIINYVNFVEEKNIHIHYELYRGTGFVDKLPDIFSKRLTYKIVHGVYSTDSKTIFEINVPDDNYINSDVSLKGYLVSDLTDSNKAVWVFEETKPLSYPIIIEYSTYERKIGDNISLINFIFWPVLFISNIFRWLIIIKFKTLLKKDFVELFFKLFNPWTSIVYVVTFLLGVYFNSSNLFIMLKYSHAWISIPVVIGIFVMEYLFQRHSRF